MLKRIWSTTNRKQMALCVVFQVFSVKDKFVVFFLVAWFRSHVVAFSRGIFKPSCFKILDGLGFDRWLSFVKTASLLLPTSHAVQRHSNTGELKQSGQRPTSLWHAQKRFKSRTERVWRKWRTESDEPLTGIQNLPKRLPWVSCVTFTLSCYLMSRKAVMSH